jgi:hypothetical protein
MVSLDIVEIGATAGGIVLAIAGYLLEVSALEFFGIACACVSLGVLLARVLSGRA